MRSCILNNILQHIWGGAVPTHEQVEAMFDRPRAGPGIISVAMRRWPLLLLGALCGAALGFLIYSQQPAIYESRAQVLVIKNRGEQISPTDFRTSFVEDYVSTQLAVIKSERILLACVRKLIPNQFTPPLPDDELTRYQQIARNLTVVRDRDTSAGVGMGSAVVNLALRGVNGRDCRIILETLITTYQAELSNVYNQETKKLIRKLEAEITSRRESRQSRADEALRLDQQRLAITPEALHSVSARLSLTRDRLNAINLELIELVDQLQLISKTGKNRRDRVATFVLLGGQKRQQQTIDTNSPENMLLVLNAQRQEQSDRLGKEHPTMKSLDAQIGYYKKLVEAQNPDDPTGELDELAILEKRLIQRKRTAELQQKELQSLIALDTKTVQDAGPLQTSAEQLRANMIADLKEENARQDQLDTLNKTEQSGGFEANILTAPREGVRVGPNIVLWLAGGFAVGVLAGVLMAYIAESTDHSFRSPAEIRQRLGVPIYGHIPKLRMKLPAEVEPVPQLDAALVSALRPKSIEAEAYRGVRAQLMLTMQNRTHRVVQITSPNPGDGKSTLAANLAISLAQTGQRVILLDCDFRKPRQHQLFQLKDEELGLASVVNGNVELNDAIQPSGVEHLDILPCGPRPANPAELLTSMSFQDVLNKLRAHYDSVIVDTPPLLAVSDPRVVAQRVDAVLMVFQISKQARPSAERAREQLVDMGANLMGVVINGTSAHGGEYGYGYHYNYSYDYEYAEQYAHDSGTEPNA